MSAELHPGISGGRGFIALADRRIAFEVAGEGQPAVVLETGLGAESVEWRPVQAEVARRTRVFRYDRAGRGASDPAPDQRTAMDMVEELRETLRLCGVTPPHVLVGHSYGGLMMRLFAHRYPHEVAGLVLVDSMHEDQFDVFGPFFPPPAASDPEQLSSMRAFWTGGWRDPQATVERIDLVASRLQGHEVASLGNLPMRVLVASWNGLEMAPVEARARMQIAWNGLQARLAGLSKRAIVVPVEDSDHFIQRHRPDVVAAAICSVLDEVKAERPTW